MDDLTMPSHPLHALALTPMHTPLPTRLTAHALSHPPFLPIPGALNLRDLGLSAPAHIRPGLIFRSGALDGLSDAAKAELVARTKVRTVFDLRSARERMRAGSVDLSSFSGEGEKAIETVWLPPAAAPMVLDPADFATAEGRDGFVGFYLDVLRTHAPAFERVVRHLCDFPERAVLFHCTAGKDRTGVLAALLLSLAGAPPELISAEYALSRIGIEPAREALTSLLCQGMGRAMDAPGMAELGGARAASMAAFLEAVEEEYEGGTEGYARRVLGLIGEEVERVKRVLGPLN